MSKTYLVCPLNWGLGHASRLITIIMELQKQNQKIILAGDGDALLLLRNQFPTLPHIRIKDVNIKLSNKHKIFNLFKIAYKLFIIKIRENKKLKNILKNNKIDVVISDNRYGLYNKKVESILITHQLFVKLPDKIKFIEKFAHSVTLKLLNKFNEIWIPDYADENKNLSGDLSHKYKIPNNAKFIGPLSRFKYVEAKETKYKFDTIAILSGPEPARSSFEKKIIERFTSKENKVLIIQGIQNQIPEYISINNNITKISCLPASEIKYYLLHAKKVISRSGYTSIMDYDYLNIEAELHPTPGQTEQEYLATKNNSYINKN